MTSPEMFPKSVVLRFPVSVYQKTGVAEMLPKLLETLKVEDLRCVQFLCGAKILVSFREKTVRDDHRFDCFQFDGLIRHAETTTAMYLRDLPYGVASDDVLDFFRADGDVLTVERSVSSDFPSVHWKSCGRSS